MVKSPAEGAPLPSDYRLAPCEELSDPTFVTGEHGRYHALDTAVLQIAAAVRADPAR